MGVIRGQLEKVKKVANLFICITIGISLCLPLKALAVSTMGFEIAEQSQIEKFIEDQMHSGKIPGLSVAIVKGNDIYTKGFGYADIKGKNPVTSKTLFELGSDSKAYTALGILSLQEKGLIDLNAPVSEYIKWFKMYYNETEADIRLKNLLFHTSGIPFKTIGDISASEAKDSLEQAVRTLVGKKLDFNPGERHSYATINYDVLGLVIEKVTGQSYEKFMADSVLIPLGLANTFITREEALKYGMATGYKIGFTRALEYRAPIYKGNTPAGYIISNANDMGRWLSIQLGETSLNGFSKGIIDKSHIPDRTVRPAANGASYASGWYVFQRGAGELSHGGSNPNFSAYMGIRPGEKIGVAVLANMNSNNTQVIGQGIIDIMIGKKPSETASDLFKNLDNISITVICVAIPLMLSTLWFIGVFLIQRVRNQRSFKFKGIKGLVALALSALLITIAGYCIYRLPSVLYSDLPWSFIRVWAPQSLFIAIYMACASLFLFCIYFILTYFFIKEEDGSFYSITILSMLSGFGNALIIFITNEALNRSSSGFDSAGNSSLYLYFLMGIILYVLGQKIVRARLIRVTNNLVYSKRMELINIILNTSYQELDNIEKGKIQAGLNNDTETISNFANILVGGLTGLITLICCFVYLGVINVFGLFVSVLVIAISAGLYYIAGRSARKLWEKTRDIQNIFFQYIGDLLYGFKELSLSRVKRHEFKEDIQGSCDLYRRERINASSRFVNVFVIGELMYTAVIGIVSFIFPVIFKDIKTSMLTNYVFVFLYMNAPVHAVLNAIPNAIQMKVSWNRMNGLIKKLSSVGKVCNTSDVAEDQKHFSNIHLKDIEYEYESQNDEKFGIGPIDINFSCGEITFITGGNGSGKSTLAKLLTGLYAPKSGDILINGKRVGTESLGEFHSAVFSDFYLFQKLYGINCENKMDEIVYYLKVMRLSEKVKVNGGRFDTLKLSSGQRKRLALMISYLEDRPVFTFDEWAADQDPEFKKFFYYELLPALKKMGKCVIAITHDDHYFHIADRIIKMDSGKIVNE